jgi:hypothetical protein
LEADYYLPWHNRGISLHALRRYAEAIDDFSKAVELKPDFASSWSARGDAKSALRRWKEAIDDYTQSIALKPDNELVWRRRGEAHRYLRQWQEAEADFRKSLDLNRDSVAGLFGLGFVLAHKQQFANARSAFERIGGISSAEAAQRELAARMADRMTRLCEMEKRFPEILSGATQAAVKVTLPTLQRTCVHDGASRREPGFETTWRREQASWRADAPKILRKSRQSCDTGSWIRTLRPYATQSACLSWAPTSGRSAKDYGAMWSGSCSARSTRTKHRPR